MVKYLLMIKAAPNRLFGSCCQSKHPTWICPSKSRVCFSL